MFAKGARNQCTEIKIDRLIDDLDCEKVYWDWYCLGNIGDPNKEKCREMGR
jgi:hypothetical protein